MTKYHARRVEADGLKFDSQAEYRRYCELKLRLRNGEITNLLMHPKFALNINKTVVGHYIADFEYATLPDYQTVIEDVKGVRTPVYRLKKKLMKALYGIDIVEVEA